MRNWLSAAALLGVAGVSACGGGFGGGGGMDVLSGPQAPSCPTALRGPVDVEPPWSTACRNVRTTPSGLQFYQITGGPPGGEAPGPDDVVTVDYEGFLADGGQKFDSSYDRAEPAKFPVGAVIDGWTEVLQLMTPGDSWMVYIPSTLAYGDQSRGDVIGPYSDLVFRIDLIDVEGDAPQVVGGGSEPAPAPAPQGPDMSDRVRSDIAAWQSFTPWTERFEGQQSLSRGGVQYLVLQSGPRGGARPDSNDIVVVDYEGRLAHSGRRFDSTWNRAEPKVFSPGDVIEGWGNALQAMRPGDRWLVYIPSRLAYGDEGAGDVIAPGEDVVFEVYLHGVREVPGPG